MPKTVLFLQGASAGAHAEDAVLVAALRRALPEATFLYPRLDGLEEIDWTGTSRGIATALAGLPRGSLVIGHSLGGSGLLEVLSERPAPGLAGIFLLAPPYTVSDGEWGEGDFAISPEAIGRLAVVGPIRFYHSEDDDIVPFRHLALWREKLPDAGYRTVDGMGHQFTARPFVELIADIAR